jgi:hypothetical protein
VTLSDRGAAEVRVAVEVAAPVADVFAAMTDWRRQSEWVALTRVDVTSGDGRSVGSVLEAFTGVGPVGFLDVMEITAWKPPFEVGVLHVGRLVRGPGSMRVEELSEGRVLMVWQEWLHLPLGRLGRLVWPVMRLVAAGGLRRSLRRLCRNLEAQQ